MISKNQFSALTEAVRQIELHVSTGGWDGPVRVFALVNTAEAIHNDPSFAREIGADVRKTAEQNPKHLTSIEQEGLPASADVEELLAQMAWPPSVTGVAISMERIVVPPQVEQDLPADPEQALQVLMNHPERQDVRLVAGVLRDGETSCAVRTRNNDDDDAVGFGPDVAPSLLQALAATLED